MGLGERAYYLLRAYIGREWERIETVRQLSARAELNAYLQSPVAPVQETRSGSPPDKPKDKLQEAYDVLGLSRGADLEDLKRAYNRLSERSLPANFPEGSEERKKAAEIHARVQEVYDLLLPILNPRLKRFQSLDIEK